MVSLMFLLGACQESVSGDEIQESNGKSMIIESSDKVPNDIVARLQAYNDSLYSSAATSSSINGTSSFRDKLKKWLDISVADFIGRCEGTCYGLTIGGIAGPEGMAIGAAVLGPLVGACRSYQAANSYASIPVKITFNNSIPAYIKMKEDITDYSPYYPDKIDLQLPPDKLDLLIEGAQHNLLLDNITKNTFSSTTAEEAYAKGILSEEEYLVLSDSRTPAILFRLVYSNTSDDSYDFGETSNAIIKLYKEAIQELSNDYIDVESISNRYVSEIYSSSELEETQKDNIVSSIGVMASSVEYWKVFDAEHDIE